jgi:phosphoadenosine phosphosulfate reductase
MNIALHFSGGKDSLACLHLYKDFWDKMYVIWVNTGAVYPEMQAYMDGWKKKLPHFVEVESDQPRNIEENGWPVDVLPVNNTALGLLVTGKAGPMLQPYLSCCATNIWLPLHEATKKLGVKKVIKGQRLEDGRKSTTRHGSIIDGIELVMPIENWTTEQVFRYLAQVGAELPPGYADGEKTGRDCWDCTAYLDDNKKRIANLPSDRQAIIRDRLAQIEAAIKEEQHGV